VSITGPDIGGYVTLKGIPFFEFLGVEKDSPNVAFEFDIHLTEVFFGEV